MQDLKGDLTALIAHLGELETAARLLPNQNFADIVKSGIGKLSQLCDHPDVQAVAEKLYGPDQAALPIEGAATGDVSNMAPSQAPEPFGLGNAPRVAPNNAPLPIEGAGAPTPPIS